MYQKLYRSLYRISLNYIKLNKDNSPKWNPPTAEAVTDDWIDAIFAPLPENEKWTPLT